jgi:hypothetical protein
MELIAIIIVVVPCGGECDFSNPPVKVIHLG